MHLNQSDSTPVLSNSSLPTNYFKGLNLLHFSHRKPHFSPIPNRASLSAIKVWCCKMSIDDSLESTHAWLTTLKVMVSATPWLWLSDVSLNKLAFLLVLHSFLFRKKQTLNVMQMVMYIIPIFQIFFETKMITYLHYWRWPFQQPYAILAIRSKYLTNI